MNAINNKAPGEGGFDEAPTGDYTNNITALVAVNQDAATYDDWLAATMLGIESDVMPTKGKVPIFKGWQNYHAKLEDIKKWSANRNYNMSIITRHVRAIDVDVEHPALANEIREFINARHKLPARGRADSSKFLLAVKVSGDHAKRVFKTEHNGKIEALMTGQQFVAAGLHPEGERYSWGDDGVPWDIPAMTIEEFDSLWGDIKSKFGIGESHTSTASTKKEKLADAMSGDPVVQHLQFKALVKSSAADGKLFIDCPWKDQHSMDSGYTETTYYPAHTGGYVNGHFKCLHAGCEARTDAEFLDALGYVPPNEFEVITADAAAAVVDSLPTIKKETITTLQPFPGVMDEVVTEVLRVAPKPQPELTMMAVLIGMAAAIPGHYKLPSGARLNLYGCNIAATGEGKDKPQQVARDLVLAAGGHITGRPASGEGLEDALESRKATFITLDEIAHLFSAMNSSKAGAHLQSLASMLLQLFSASAHSISTRALAKAPSVTIYHPSVSILGSATPEKLGESFGTSNIVDGLLGRMMFAMGRDDVRPRRVQNSFNMPKSVSDIANSLACSFSNSLDNEENAGHEQAIVIPDEVGFAFDAMMTRNYEQRLSSTSPFAKALLTRSFEKAERVAGVLAIWDKPIDPVMLIDHVEWAEAFVTASDKAMIQFIADFMHGGQVQTDAALLLRLHDRILKGEFKPQSSSEASFIAQKTVSHSMLLRVSKLDKKSMNEAVEHLIALGDIDLRNGAIHQPNGSIRSVKVVCRRENC